MIRFLSLSGGWGDSLGAVLRHISRGRAAAVWIAVVLTPLFPLSGYGDEQVPSEAAIFLEALEPAPSAAELFDFMRAYVEDFSACKDPDVFMKTLRYLEERGELNAVRIYMETLTRCGETAEDAGSRRP